MIVKNESKIIERLLQSVLPLIDTYCICDTGSTDNTINIINSFFKKNGIKGKVVEEPFKDFGYNRTYALNKCIGMKNADYLLLLDADMVLKIGDNVNIPDFKNSLNSDIYYISQGSHSFFYNNVRMVKNTDGISYWGVTHEYLNHPDNMIYNTITKDVLFINDIGDGGSKKDKFLRDINLLKKGLDENPNNDRYTFYLANSYYDSDQYENAIDMYKKRIKLGGWVEEVWYSYYKLGLSYKFIGNMPTAIHYWIEGYNCFPDRVENLYEIVNYYRIQKKYELAYTYYNLARYVISKKQKYENLFLHKDIYDYKLDYELSIIGYYCNWEKHNIINSIMKVLAYPNIDIVKIKNVLSNYKYYTPSLTNKNNAFNKFDNNIKINYKDYNTSTPSICFIENNSKIILNTRYVNYHINEKGEYINKETINSMNVISVFDTLTQTWVKIKDFVMNYNKTYDNLYVGLEDVRLLYNNGLLHYTANRGINATNICIEYGTIDINNPEKISSSLMRIKNQKKIEKNWVLFNDKDNNINMIYKWYPLTIGDIIKGVSDNVSKFIMKSEENTPSFFMELRGSTNGVTIDNEIWFLCHIVSYDERRYYYHCMVVLDKNTNKLKKYSYLFTFEKKPIEYTLGFVYNDNLKELIIGYSLMDRETKFIFIGLNELEFYHI